MLRLLSGYWQWLTLPFEGGGGSSTTTVNVPDPSAAETEAQEIALRRLRRQEELEKQFPDFDKKQIQLSLSFLEEFDQQRKARVAAGITPEENARIEAEQIQRAARMGKIEEELANLQLETIKRGTKATPEQLETIEQARSAAQKTGEADIERFRTDTLRQINEEVASASGLRPTDTPVLRLSERAGEESARQQGMLTSRLAETAATARLNLPLASQKLMADIAAQQQSLAQASQDFQGRLAQRAQENRFRLFQQPLQNVQTNFAMTNPATFGMGLSQLRLGLAGRTTTSDKDFGLGELGQAAGGIGSLLSAGNLIFSDRRLKRDIYRIGQLPSGIPVYMFRFTGYEDWYVGCLADEVLKEIPEAVSEDAEGYQLVNYALLH